MELRPLRVGGSQDSFGVTRLKWSFAYACTNSDPLGMPAQDTFFFFHAAGWDPTRVEAQGGAHPARVATLVTPPAVQALRMLVGATVRLSQAVKEGSGSYLLLQAYAGCISAIVFYLDSCSIPV